MSSAFTPVMQRGNGVLKCPSLTLFACRLHSSILAQKLRGWIMNLVGPERFKVSYTPEKPTILCERGTSKFSGHMTSRKPKLYIFSRDSIPIYVGATVQGMASRLNQGWKARGASGYHGYRFRHDGSEVNLDVWVDIDEVQARADDLRSGSDIETVEAEIVYLLRHRTEQWPAFQTEIHFYQSASKHREKAEKVLAFYGL